MCKNKRSLSKIGDKNPMWKGDEVKYRALHAWVKRHKPKSDCCNKCKRKTRRLELSNISGKHKRDINDYEWLCVICHRQGDATTRMMDGKFRRIGMNNKSGVLGVSYCKRDKNWRAHITINKKQIFLLSSKDKGKAIKARRLAEKNMPMIKKMLNKIEMKAAKLMLRHG